MWRKIDRDVPESEPILVCYGERLVVALAFAADYYWPETTFMDARTFDILPTPSHWMLLPDRPRSTRPSEPIEPASRCAA